MGEQAGMNTSVARPGTGPEAWKWLLLGGLVEEEAAHFSGGHLKSARAAAREWARPEGIERRSGGSRKELSSSAFRCLFQCDVITAAHPVPSGSEDTTSCLFLDCAFDVWKACRFTVLNFSAV